MKHKGKSKPINTAQWVSIICSLFLFLILLPWGETNALFDPMFGLKSIIDVYFFASFILIIPICILLLSLYNILQKTYNHREYGIIVMVGASILLYLLLYIFSKPNNFFIFLASTLIILCLSLLYIGYLEIGFNKRKIIVASAHEVNYLLTKISDENPNASIDEISLQFIERIRSKPDALKRLSNAIKVGGLKAIEAYSDHPAVAFALGAYEEWVSSAPQENEEEL